MQPRMLQRVCFSPSVLKHSSIKGRLLLPPLPLPDLLVRVVLVDGAFEAAGAPAAEPAAPVHTS